MGTGAGETQLGGGGPKYLTRWLRMKSDQSEQLAVTAFSPSSPHFSWLNLLPRSSFWSPWTLPPSFPKSAACVCRVLKGSDAQSVVSSRLQVLPCAVRTCWTAPKMEENFQSAIETSASFSSLLGECSGCAPRAHSLSSTLSSSGVQLAGTQQ